MPIGDAHVRILLRGFDEAVRTDPEHELAYLGLARLRLWLPLRIQCPREVAVDEVRRARCADDGKAGSAADARIVSLNAHVLFLRRFAAVVDGLRIALQVDAVPILVRCKVLAEEPDPSGRVVLDGIHRACTDRPIGRLQQPPCVLSGR